MPSAYLVLIRRDTYETLAPVKVFLSRAKADTFIERERAVIQANISLHGQAQRALDAWDNANPPPDPDKEHECFLWNGERGREERRLHRVFGITSDTVKLLHTTYSLVNTSLDM